MPTRPGAGVRRPVRRRSISRTPAAAAAPFTASFQSPSATRWCAAIASSAAVTIATPVGAPGMRVRPERVDRQRGAVAGAQDLEIAGRLGAGEQAELQPHRLGLHQGGDVQHLGRRHLAAQPARPLRQRGRRRRRPPPGSRISRAAEIMQMMLGLRTAYSRLRAARMPSAWSAVARICARVRRRPARPVPPAPPPAPHRRTPR